MNFNLMPFFAELMITVEKQEEERERRKERRLPIIWKALWNMQIHWHTMMRMMCDCCRCCCIVSMCYTEARIRSNRMMAKHSSPRRCSETILIHFDGFSLNSDALKSLKAEFISDSVQLQNYFLRFVKPTV